VIGVEFLADWLGEEVLGADGEKAGKLEEIYLDGTQPVIAEVKAGGLRRKTHLVPLDGAVVGRDYVRVAHSAALVGGAPGHSGDGPPDAATLNGVAEHYGLLLRGEGGTLEGSTARKARLAAEEEAERAEAEAERARAEAERARGGA